MHAAQMFENRLRKRHKHLRKWARSNHITCYRLYDRDIPEIPLSVDLYGDHVHIARYLRDHGPSIEPAWLQAMARSAARALDIPDHHVHIKERERQRGSAQYQRVAASNELSIVSEGGHRFAVNLDDYLDTGLFLDHRLTRARIEREAAGKRFLNLFCYTASFTVYAAKGGAIGSVSVDLSNRYLEWAAHNLALNHIDTRAHRLVRADVFEYLAGRVPAHEADAGELFDLAVLDPPTFSNSKKMSRVLDTQRDHVELIVRTLEHLRPGGVLYFSTNYRRFKLDTDGLLAAGVADITDITQDTQPHDFQRRVHQCWRLVKPSA